MSWFSYRFSYTISQLPHALCAPTSSVQSQPAYTHTHTHTHTHTSIYTAQNVNAPTVLTVVENTQDVHNLIVCTLCSCYPAKVLFILLYVCPHTTMPTMCPHTTPSQLYVLYLTLRALLDSTWPFIHAACKNPPHFYLYSYLVTCPASGTR
jgi:hypothetical protein